MCHGRGNASGMRAPVRVDLAPAVGKTVFCARIGVRGQPSFALAEFSDLKTLGVSRDHRPHSPS